VIESTYLSETRSGYDAVAGPYAEAFRSALDDSPLDRALLTGFAELVANRHPDGQLIEVGSGPGHVAAYLRDLGLSIRGIDLSSAMVDLARREHPEITFDVGEMGALDASDSSLAGLVAWYSIIHVPPAHLPAVFTEFHRVLTDGGHLLLAFQIGGQRSVRQDQQRREAGDATGAVTRNRRATPRRGLGTASKSPSRAPPAAPAPCRQRQRSRGPGSPSARPRPWACEQARRAERLPCHPASRCPLYLPSGPRGTCRWSTRATVSGHTGACRRPQSLSEPRWPYDRHAGALGMRSSRPSWRERQPCNQRLRRSPTRTPIDRPRVTSR